MNNNYNKFTLSEFVIELNCFCAFIKKIKTNNFNIQNIAKCLNNLKIILSFINNNNNILEKYYNNIDSNYDISNYSYPFDKFCIYNIINNIKEIEYKYNTNITDKLYPIIDENNNINTTNNNDINNFINSLIDFNISLNSITENTISSFNVISELSDYKKILIILGPNGSGKTSVANILSSTSSLFKIIPALNTIEINGDPKTIFKDVDDYNTDDYNDEFYSKDISKENMFLKLIVALCNDYLEYNSNIQDSTLSKEFNQEANSSYYEKIRIIFESLFNIKLHLNFSGKQINVSTKTGEKQFNFNDMSDGERTGFFYISTIIIAPKNSFLVVDEPENHLNPVIYNKLWDRLIQERSDCQFIFLSHTVDFIKSRTDFNVITINNFEYPDNFNVVKFGDSLKEINPCFLTKIIGSQKPLLFYNKNNSTLIHKIYAILFGNEYTVIQLEQDTTIKQYVSTCNNLYNNEKLLQQSFGITNCCLKKRNEIKKIITNSMTCITNNNEAAMLLIDRNIFKSVFSDIENCDSIFINFQKIIFDYLKKNINTYIYILVKRTAEEALHTIYISGKPNKNNMKQKTNKEILEDNYNKTYRQINIRTLWDNAYRKIYNAISKENYDKIIQYCCISDIKIINELVNKATNIDNYIYKAITTLENNEKLTQLIREKYFKGLYSPAHHLPNLDSKDLLHSTK